MCLFFTRDILLFSHLRISTTFKTLLTFHFLIITDGDIPSLLFSKVKMLLYDKPDNTSRHVCVSIYKIVFAINRVNSMNKLRDRAVVFYAVFDNLSTSAYNEKYDNLISRSEKLDFLNFLQLFHVCFIINVIECVICKNPVAK